MKTLILALTLALSAFSQNMDYSRIRNGPGVKLSIYGPTGNAALQAAYNALPAEGGTLLLANDMSVTAATTLSIINGKNVNIDFSGHSLNCSNTSGVCLKVTHTSGAASRVKLMNGTITYTGSSTNITGLQLIDIADTTEIDHMLIRNFATTGSRCITLSNAESITFVASQCQDSYSGVLVTNFSTNLLFLGFRVEGQNVVTGGVPFRIEQQSTGITLDHTLIQTTHTIHGLEIDSTVGGLIDQIHIINSWFENVGDGTANTRAILLTANASHPINNFTVKNTLFSADTLGLLGTVFEFAGDGTALTSSPQFEKNTNSYAHLFTGTNVFPMFTLGDNAEFCDVCINRGQMPGLFWFPQTGGHQYRMWAGDSIQSGDANNWSFKDITAGVTPMHYTSATQTMAFVGPVTASTLAATTTVTGQDITPSRDMIAGRYFGGVSTNAHVWRCGSEFSRTDSDLDCYYDGTLMFRFNNLGMMGIGGGNAAIKSPLQVQSIAIFANNAAAITGGLVVGSFYRTGADPDLLAIVH